MGVCQQNCIGIANTREEIYIFPQCIASRVLSLDFCWGIKYIKSQSGMPLDGEGGLRKNISTEAKEPQDKTDSFLVFKSMKLKHSDTVFKPKCCQNWCKTVLFFFKLLGTNLRGGRQVLVQKRDKCQIFCRMGYPIFPALSSQWPSVPLPMALVP